MIEQDGGDGRICIVGVGASAGGLEAIREMLAPAEPASSIAYVVIQHLDPNHESLLAELLGRHTSLDVHQASGGEVVEAGKVYIIPPGHGLSIRNGALELTDFALPRGLRRPIDDFFESLAMDQGSNAACVILSGTGADGSAGLRAIKENGGLCIAQDPATARYEGMPVAAQSTGLVDFVRPPGRIVDCIQQFHSHRRMVEEDDKLAATLAERVDDICAVLKRSVGHDFSGYKRSTLMRRIERRIHVLNLQNAGDYLRRIRSDPAECEILFRELLINVTRFFRDTEFFDLLRTKVIAPLVRDAREDEIRVWVAGCSSGEEAYSIAMLFSEEVRRLRRPIMIQIFATDIDEQMLRIARQGLYPIAALSDIPEDMRERYTIAREGKFQMNAAIRDMIRFSIHSVVRDPPFSNIDLLSCRNMLIYLGDRLQNMALPTFHYALKPGGTLFLGPSETVGRHDDLFHDFDQRARLFTRSEMQPSFPVHLRGPRISPRDGRDSSDDRPIRLDWQRDSATDRLLKVYSPPSLHLATNGEILSSTGQLGKYLAMEPGRSEARFAQSLARPGLREAVSALIRRATESGRRVVTRNLVAQSEFGQQEVDVIVDPLPDRTLLLVFRDRDRFEPREEEEFDDLEPSDSHVQSLEDELRSTRARLHTTVEELETANEELKSSNEEMMSMNEELQSTNEELATVNDELKSKVDQLSVANADLHNFFASTALPLVVVDARMNIRNFTEAILNIYPFRSADRGRPLQEVTSVLEDDGEVCARLREVIEGGEPGHLRVTERDGLRTWALLITPYRTRDGIIDGATMVFTDLTEALQLEHALEEEGERLRLALRVTRLGVWEYDPADLTWTLDPTSRRLIGLPADETGPVPTARIMRRIRQDSRREVRSAFERLQRGESTVDMTFGIVNGEQDISLRGVGKQIRFRTGRRVLGVISDVTIEHEAARVRELMLREMNHRVKNMFSIISGMLRVVGRTAATPHQMVESMESRVAALARSHDMTQRRPGTGPITLLDALEAALAPYREGAEIYIDGPVVPVDHRELTSLSLLLHELATNAAKYGVLGDIDGRLEVRWMRQNDGRVRLEWNESYSRDVEPNENKSGFGSTLVRISAAQLRGEINVDYTAKGRKTSLTYDPA